MKLGKRLFRRKRKAPGVVSAETNATYYRHHADNHKKSSVLCDSHHPSIMANRNRRIQGWRQDDEQRIQSHQQQQSITPISQQHQQGYNKTLRDSARIFLAAYSACMLYGSPYWALLWSALACLFLYHGKFWSIKNLFWGFLCWTSLPFALVAATLHGILQTILDMTPQVETEPEEAYSSTYIFFFSFERLLEVSMGFFCGFILFLTFLGKVESEIK